LLLPCPDHPREAPSLLMDAESPCGQHQQQSQTALTTEKGDQGVSTLFLTKIIKKIGFYLA